MRKKEDSNLFLSKIYLLHNYYLLHQSSYLPSYRVEEKNPCRRENLLVKKKNSENLKHLINSTVCVEESCINPLEKNNN